MRIKTKKVVFQIYFGLLKVEILDNLDFKSFKFAIILKGISV